MANLSYINIEKSIALGRLITKQDKLDKIDQVIGRIFFAALCIVVVGFIALVYFRQDISSTNDKVVTFAFFPIVVLAALYSLYRKLFETNLIKIETTLPRPENGELLLAFLMKHGYEIVGQSKAVIVTHLEESLSINKNRIKVTTFLLTDEAIYFNMIKEQPKINLPVFFSHLFLKADLRKYFKGAMK
jgi:hypothetical protein